MKRYIEINEEVLVNLVLGKRVEGSLFEDKQSGKLTFKAYNRNPYKRPKDKIICQLENGWLKESAQRIKFFNSVRKDVGAVRVGNAMRRELTSAMGELYYQKLIEQ